MKSVLRSFRADGPAPPEASRAAATVARESGTRAADRGVGVGRGAFRRVATANEWPLMVLVACYWIAALLFGLRPSFQPLQITLFVVAASLVALLTAVTRWRWHHARRNWSDAVDQTASSRWALVFGELRRGALAPDRVLGGILVLVAIAIFLQVFVAWKTSIPRFHAYDWDPRLARMDEWLHGGVAPWVWTHRWFGSRIPTLAIDWAYGAWYTVVIGTVVWQAYARRSAERVRFFVSFVLVWVALGTVMAVFLASGGPVYYGRLAGGADPFAPLLAGLDGYGVRARVLQEMLWEGFTGRSDYLAEGISAMPSVHVGVAALLALFGWSRGKAIGLAYTAFALVVLIGSVHLGWHYAIDGYVAILATAAIWVGSGLLVGRRGPVSAPAGATMGRHE